MIVKQFPNKKVANCYFWKVAKNPNIKLATSGYSSIYHTYTVEYEYYKPGEERK